tara:strand:+ start:3147 stop:3554 length:408 start_codon:yes stop_codon:yes gene_type:complete
MDNKVEIFDGKSFGDLMQEIHQNSLEKKTQIDLMIQEIVSMIKTSNDAVQLAPMVKDYLEVAVKNDEQLVKMATIVQRIINTESKGSESEYQLSDAEKKQLLGGIEDAVNDLQGHSNKLKTDIDTLKTKGAQDGI